MPKLTNNNTLKLPRIVLWNIVEHCKLNEINYVFAGKPVLY